MVSRPIFDEESKNALEIAVRAVVHPPSAWGAQYMCADNHLHVTLCLERQYRARTPDAYGLIAGGVVSELIFDAEFKNILGFTVRAVVGPPPARRCAVQCAHDT